MIDNTIIRYSVMIVVEPLINKFIKELMWQKKF
ncbi:MAG: hypothetical protein DK302_001123 [Chloroflexi bacterium]|jgi:hypothetical protein|nr:MAG: hypothetical protein DK302_001123 [Chloroflexota bacterium]